MKIYRSLCSCLFAMLLAGLLLAGDSAWAQVGLGSISGTLTDATGAAINDATVTLTNTDRNEVVRTVKTSGTGYYKATSLPLGGYTVKVSWRRDLATRPLRTSWCCNGQRYFDD